MIKLSILKTVILISLVFLFTQCGENPTVSNFQYQPQNFNDGWITSTPEEQGVNTDALNAAYQSADYLNNIYSLLVVKNGSLIAEKYFNGKTIFAAMPVASVTKSYMSALTGIALRENILTSLDQKMMDFFPELDWESEDPRKKEITIRQMLQMRSGYPWEEFSGDLNTLFNTSDWIHLLADFDLSRNPGSAFGYSNLTAHMLSIILERASGASTFTLAVQHIFNPLNANLEYWPSDANGYYYGSGDMCIAPRDMAKFGQMYLDNGLYNGIQIIPGEWVEESLEAYSYDTYGSQILDSMGDLDYGYLWWSSSAGGHDFNFAWGHGGQLIAVVHDLNMVIVTTADYLHGEPAEVAWPLSKAVMEIAGRLIGSL